MNEESHKQIIVQCKFLDGVIHYNKEEERVLVEWMKGKEVRQLYHFFTKHVLKDKPYAKLHFPDSVLANIFKKARVK